jgi:hypothetical protein
MRDAARGTPSGGWAGCSTPNGGGSAELDTPPAPYAPDATSSAVSGLPSGATRILDQRMAASSSATAFSRAAGEVEAEVRAFHSAFAVAHVGASASDLSIDSRKMSCEESVRIERVAWTTETQSWRRWIHNFLTAFHGTRSSSAVSCFRAPSAASFAAMPQGTPWHARYAQAPRDAHIANKQHRYLYLVATLQLYM